MIWNPNHWRTALRLEAAYRRYRTPPATAEPPWSAWRRLTDTLRRYGEAERRGWRHARRREFDTVVRHSDDLLAQVRVLRAAVESGQLSIIPSVGEFYAELVAAEDEFGGVAFDDDELYVTTEPITLDDIYLGPFEIRLNLNRLDEQEPYRIVAVEPHPARSCSATTHPHVHNDKVCLGEGKPAVAAALAEGRLGDLFQLINRVLHTYGEGSAYVALSEWYGTPCSECDDSVDEDELYSCTICDASVCPDCVRLCNCGSAACSSCASHCYGCEDTTCSRCLSMCPDCERDFCSNCLEEGLCDACREREEEERLAQETELADDEPADDECIVAEPSVHTAGMGQAVVLAGPRRRRSRRLRNLQRR